MRSERESVGKGGPKLKEEGRVFSRCTFLSFCFSAELPYVGRNVNGGVSFIAHLIGAIGVKRGISDNRTHVHWVQSFFLFTAACCTVSKPRKWKKKK
jgi:hypothetical protein